MITEKGSILGETINLHEKNYAVLRAWCTIFDILQCYANFTQNLCNCSLQCVSRWFLQRHKVVHYPVQAYTVDVNFGSNVKTFSTSALHVSRTSRSWFCEKFWIYMYMLQLAAVNFSCRCVKIAIKVCINSLASILRSLPGCESAETQRSKLNYRLYFAAQSHVKDYCNHSAVRRISHIASRPRPDWRCCPDTTARQYSDERNLRYD